jgi:hypothetical protein
MLMPTTEAVQVQSSSAGDALSAKHGEIATAEQHLAELEAAREAAAVAGEETRGLRQQVAETSADLEELRMQEGHLALVVAEEEQAQVHRGRQAALTEVYRRDVEYLKATKHALAKQAERDRAREECTRLTRRDWYDPQLEGRGHRHPDLHGNRDSDAPVVLAPLRTSEPSSGQGQPPVQHSLDADIARLERLATESEEASRDNKGDRNE